MKPIPHDQAPSHRDLLARRNPATRDRVTSAVAGRSGRVSRRRFFDDFSAGLAAMALASISADESKGQSPEIDAANPHQVRPPHFDGRAKNVIVVFCSGALSQVDTFDYKPELIRRHGQPLPGNEKLVSFQGPNGNLTKPLWTFRPRGQCGKYTSDLLPRLGNLADEICFFHSLSNKSNTHGPAENVMNTGFT